MKSFKRKNTDKNLLQNRKTKQDSKRLIKFDDGLIV